MAIMANLKDEKGNPIELKLEHPAFLVGNGINLADGCNELKWDKLLVKVLFGEDKDKNEKSEEILEEEFKGLNCPEIAELAEWYRKNSANEQDTKMNHAKTIKRQICKKIVEQEEAYKNQNKRSEFFARFCHDNKIPVLTTNFDHRLLLSLDIKNKKWNKNFKSEIEEPYYTKFDKTVYKYPFRAYFAEKEIKPEKIHSEFAVWHVHGTKRYISSIRINNVDYAKNIIKIDQMISDKKLIGTDIDHGKGSWIDIFMKNDLIILGLALKSQETDLRWLLRERYVYQKLTYKSENLLASTIYIYDTQKGIASGTKKLFELLGIICVPMEQNDIFNLEKYLSGK